MRCPGCGVAAEDGAWFCVHCCVQLVPDQELLLQAPSGTHGLESEPTAPADTASKWLLRSPAVVRLTVVEGPDAGRRVELQEGQGLIGRSREAALVLQDSEVSRRHAEVRTTAEGVVLVDLSSRNGSFVDGTLIRRALLPSHGRFRLGPHTEIRAQVGPLGESESLDPAFAGYLTHHPPLRRTLRVLAQAARSDATVLLEGETGTGKELLARAVHEASDRSHGPYVVVDCGAASSSLLESQLFGHRRGAFTTALEDQVGAFEHAHGGTVFLDEIGELPLEMQPKLLRALEARTVRRLGEVTDRSIDVRFVAATHRDLRSMVEGGQFRRDLYFRLAVFRAEIPPLRQRPEDVGRLADAFVARLSEGRKTLAPATYGVLESFDWPGNVRELRNVMERAVAVGGGTRIEPKDLFQDQPEGEEGCTRVTFSEAKERMIASFERRYAESLLERNRGNMSRAAKEAGISRPALYALLKRAGVPTKGD